MMGIQDDHDALVGCLTSQAEPFSNRWPDPLSRKYIGQRDTNLDSISLRDVTTIDIYESPEDRFEFAQHDGLGTEEIDQWLGSESIAGGPARQTRTATTRARILIGEQIFENDGLRPPFDRYDAVISQRKMSAELRISEAIFAKLGKDVPTFSKLPSFMTSGGTNAYIVVGCRIATTWSYDLEQHCVRAIVVLNRNSNSTVKKRLVEVLKAMQRFSPCNRYLPYVICDVEVAGATEFIDRWEGEELRNNVEVMKNQSQQKVHEIFVGATSWTTQFSRLSNFMKVVATASAHSVSCINGSPSELHPNSTGDQLARKESHLREAIEYRLAELEEMIHRSEQAHEQSRALQATVMSLLMFHQQKTTMDIAKATKEDGTSMRTLAVVATLYLPMTAIATIMSIPVFDWDASDGQHIINRRFGLFFAVTVPLTCITLGIFWYWVQLENQRTPFMTLKKRLLKVWRAQRPPKHKARRFPV